MPMSTQPALTPAPMGKILTTLTATNHRDQIRAEEGTIGPDQVRSVTLDDVLVDSGATTLCLPADVIARLGLAVRREVPIATAMGPGTARLCQDAAITLMGREGTFDCLELPAGTTPLLGVVPLEALGIEADFRNGRLRLLPEEPGNTYFTIL
jgi:predicted aspartyl protease